MNQLFQTPVEYLKGTGPARAEVLKKELSIYNFEDMLRHFPYKYIDRTRFYKIREINIELPHVQVIARLTHKEILGEIYQKPSQFKAFARDVMQNEKWLKAEFE